VAHAEVVCEIDRLFDSVGWQAILEALAERLRQEAGIARGEGRGIDAADLVSVANTLDSIR
jgi:hypothetical protein